MTTTLLPGAWQIPTVFRERMGSQVGRQRAMIADGHLLLVLHAPPKPDETRRIGRFFWRSPDGNWTSNEFGTGINAINSHLDEYQEIISKLDAQAERAATAQDLFDVLDRIAPVYRASRNLYTVLQEARKSCPEYREIINLRDRAYDTEREAELLYNGTKNALDFAVAKRAEEQAAASHRMAVSAHRLNVLVAFFFPIATLSGIFGVNLRTGLENAAPPLTFLVVISLGLICGGVLTIVVTRNR
jgi:Mg2+ and Co2+ transporter CorA